MTDDSGRRAAETEVDRGPGAAGETGLAEDGPGDEEAAEVIVGEIPDAHDLSHMLWTARCTFARHGLLGTFEERGGAEAAKQQHLVAAHGGAPE